MDRNVLESDQRKALLFETFFVWMNFIEGIPIAILNLIVFASIIIIVKSPSGAVISSCSTKSKSTTSKNYMFSILLSHFPSYFRYKWVSIYILIFRRVFLDTSQFAANEKPAFIFIGNLALADFFVAVTQNVSVYIHKKMKSDYNSYR